MRSFFHIVRLSFQQQLTYRTAILAGIATNLFFGLLRASIIIALYQGRGEVNDLTLKGALTYIAVSQGMIAFLYIFGTSDVMTSVYNGSIGSDLLKPLNLFTLWLGRDLGRSFVNLFGRGFLMIGLFALFFPITVPTRLDRWLMLTLAMSLGWLVSFAWRFLVNLFAFWTPDARGFLRIGFTLSQLFSGFLMPLRLYPDWFVSICNLTPFPALFNTSLEVYLGLLTGRGVWLALLNQALWFLALAALSQFVLTLGVRRLVIQGG